MLTKVCYVRHVDGFEEVSLKSIFGNEQSSKNVMRKKKDIRKKLKHPSIYKAMKCGIFHRNCDLNCRKIFMDAFLNELQLVMKNQISKSKRILTKNIDEKELEWIYKYSKNFPFEEAFEMGTGKQWIFNNELNTSTQFYLASKSYVGLKQINNDLNEICKKSHLF